MSVVLEDLRLAGYRGFAVDAHALRLDELALEFDTSTDDVRNGLRELAEARHVVLDELDLNVMAYPFSAQPMGFSVMSDANLWCGSA